ncbi:MAG: 6-bladed beta-propeller [Bacteroidota bacterium]
MGHKILKWWLPFWFFTIILWGGCTGRGGLSINSSQSPLSRIDVTYIGGNKLPVHHLVEIENLISLGNSENVVIGSILDVIKWDDRIYISDPATHQIHVFEEGGEFLFDFGQTGRGPGEFLNISGIRLQPDHQRLLLFSSEAQKLIYYDRDGKHLSEHKLSFYAEDVVWMGLDKLLFYTEYNTSDASGHFDLLFTDAKGKIEDRRFPYPKERRAPGFAYAGYLLPLHDGAIYSGPYKDTLWGIYPDRNEILALFDFGSGRLPNEEFEQISLDNVDMLKYTTISWQTANDVVWSGLIFQNRAGHIFFLNIETNRFISGKDLQQGSILPFINRPVISTGFKNLCTSFTLSDIALQEESNSDYLFDLQEAYPIFKPLLDSIDQDANPILLFYKINQDSLAKYGYLP